MTKNIHGLGRDIPEYIRRRVRQECGFGCVICGLAIAQYEHIDPPFSDATVHDPENIALLCGTCHDHVTRGIWSKEKILEARKTPKTFVQGYARDAFDFKAPFDLFVGDNCFADVHCVIRKSTGDEWFSIEAPEDAEAPPLLSAKFFALNGQPELEIYQNEWRCSTGIWDLQVSGQTIEVRTESRKVMLRLKARPPHGLEIQYLKMVFQNTGISIDNDGTVLLSVDGTQIQMKGSKVASADAVFNLP
ncbi:MAG: HNH endonuclease [Candidatus Schekmanbacteria bacterium]|nr:HNH endonuclease [Candidatus Schekmanbacteria bacterium]